MKLLKTFFIGLLVMAWAAACRNDHEAEPEPLQATITLASPGEGEMFLANATVPITGTITAPVSMHGYEITLRHKATGALLFSTAGHGHGTTITFNEQWVNTLSSDAVVELEITAILDHEDNRTTKKITIHCHS